MVVVRLVVLVPVVTSLDTVEVARFSGAELVVPPVRLSKGINNEQQGALTIITSRGSNVLVQG